MNSTDFKTTYYKNKEETRFYKLLHKEIILIAIVPGEAIVNRFKSNNTQCKNIIATSIAITKKDFDTLTRVAMLSKLLTVPKTPIK